jgi:hypothetical protein
MTIKTTTTHTLVCDRCPREQPVDYDPLHQDLNNGWQWWTRRGVEGCFGTSQRLLCPDCTERLTLFLEGHTTARGRVFNCKEADRRYRAHRAQQKHDEGERDAPWN